MEAGRLRYGLAFPDIASLAARLLVDLNEHDLNECDPEVPCSTGLTVSGEYLDLVADIDNATCHLARG